MNGLDLLILAVTILIIAYALYGRRLARSWGVNPARKTPAQEHEDGMEFVPSSPAVVFGHEFASIAGAGPITGPIIAAMFGWVPVFLWLLLGTVFFGAVHDFAALYTSVRNGGKSIGYVIELYVGKPVNDSSLSLSGFFRSSLPGPLPILWPVPLRVLIPRAAGSKPTPRRPAPLCSLSPRRWVWVF
jgi:carbon starvation protein CstA